MQQQPFSDDHDPEGVFNLAKKIYDHRSDIAHGKVKTNPSFNYRGHPVSSPDMAPLLLRALLRSRPLSKHPWTKKDLEPRIRASVYPEATPYRSARCPERQGGLVTRQALTSQESRRSQSVHKRHENGPRRDLRGPSYLVAGTGFEPATSGL